MQTLSDNTELRRLRIFGPSHHRFGEKRSNLGSNPLIGRLYCLNVYHQNKIESSVEILPQVEDRLPKPPFELVSSRSRSDLLGYGEADQARAR